MNQTIWVTQSSKFYSHSRQAAISSGRSTIQTGNNIGVSSPSAQSDNNLNQQMFPNSTRLFLSSHSHASSKCCFLEPHRNNVECLCRMLNCHKHCNFFLLHTPLLNGMSPNRPSFHNKGRRQALTQSDNNCATQHGTLKRRCRLNGIAMPFGPTNGTLITFLGMCWSELFGSARCAEHGSVSNAYYCQTQTKAPT